MDENSLIYSMGVLDEMAEALEPIDLAVEKLDAAQTEGIPTGLIRPIGEGEWTITCNVVPTRKDNVSTTFVQLSIPLTAPCPERRTELESFAVLGNDQFLMGTLLVRENCLYMKYTIVLEPTIAMEESHIQAAVFAFCQQAEVLTHRAGAVCRGEMTAEEALRAEIG